MPVIPMPKFRPPPVERPRSYFVGHVRCGGCDQHFNLDPPLCPRCAPPGSPYRSPSPRERAVLRDHRLELLQNENAMLRTANKTAFRLVFTAGAALILAFVIEAFCLWVRSK